MKKKRNENRSKRQGRPEERRPEQRKSEQRQPEQRKPEQRKSDRRQPEQEIGQKQKKTFPRAGNFLYPVPAVMVSCQAEGTKPNILTIAWAGTVCSDPPMVSISVRKTRYSYELIRKSGEFVINLTTAALVRAADLAGVHTGRRTDKFAECHLTPGKAQVVQAPIIEESPVNIECRVKQVIELGSHDMFLAEVVCVDADADLFDAKGVFHLERAGLAAYSHGAYYALGKRIGTFGFSVRRKKKHQK